MINFAFTSNYYHSSTSPAPTPAHCLPLRSIKHSMNMTSRKGFSASPETMRRTTWPWQSIFQTTLPSRTTLPGILTPVISHALHTLSTSLCRSSSEQSSFHQMTTMMGILTLAMVTILHLISAMTIWPSEELFQNYEPFPIPFAEALADRNYLNKLTSLIKLLQSPFYKMSPFNETQHFECCNILSTWSVRFVDTSTISEIHSNSLCSQNVNSSKLKFCCSSSSLFNAVLHDSNLIIVLPKSIMFFSPMICFTITSMIWKTSFVLVPALEPYLACPPCWQQLNRWKMFYANIMIKSAFRQSMEMPWSWIPIRSSVFLMKKPGKIPVPRNIPAPATNAS